MRSIVLALGVMLPVQLHAQSFLTLEKRTPQFLIEQFEQSFGATEARQARPIPVLALGLIKDFEGWIPFAYNDPVSFCTIGYGHLIARQPCGEITEKLVELGFNKPLSEPPEGTALLESDTVGARLAVQDLVKVDLLDDQFGALTSFVFNVGKTNFENSTMLDLLNEGDYTGAEGQFGRWIMADSKPLAGLINRRACEAAMFSGALRTVVHDEFRRSACVSFGITAPAGPLVDIKAGE